MKNKIMTIKTLLLMTVITPSIYLQSTQELSNESVAEAYKGNQWQYLEGKFIEEYNIQLTKASEIPQGIAAILAGTTLIRGFLANYTPKNSLVEATNLPSGVVEMASLFTLSKISYDYYMNVASTKIKKSILVKFLGDLDFHKDYIPAEFMSVFNELAKSYNNGSLSEAQIIKVYDLITHLISHEFAKRYGKEKTKSLSTLEILKTITDITKNVIK